MRSVTVRILHKACLNGLYCRRSGAYCRTGADSFPVPAEKLIDGGEILKNSRSVVSGFDPGHRYFVKKYKKNGFWRTLKRLLQYPRSFRCLAAALRLKEIGVDTPEVLLASRYCLITEILDGVRYLPECPGQAREAIPFLAKLHGSGIQHGDFNLRNLYRTRSGQFGVIDLDGSRLYSGPVPERVRFLELARLISSYLKDISCPVQKFPEITADFAADYKRITGFDFSGQKLLARVAELAARR